MLAIVNLLAVQARCPLVAVCETIILRLAVFSSVLVRLFLDQSIQAHRRKLVEVLNSKPSH